MPKITWQTLQGEAIADAQDFPGFGGGDAGIDGEAVKVVEAGAVCPGGRVCSRFVAECLREVRPEFGGQRVAGGDNAALAGVDAVKQGIADAKRHGFSGFRVQAIFPEGRDAADFQIGAEAPPHFFQAQAGIPGRHFFQRRRADDGRAGRFGVIGKAALTISRQSDGLLKIAAQPALPMPPVSSGSAKRNVLLGIACLKAEQGTVCNSRKSAGIGWANRLALTYLPSASRIANSGHGPERRRAGGLIRAEGQGQGI